MTPTRRTRGAPARPGGGGRPRSRRIRLAITGFHDANRAGGTFTLGGGAPQPLPGFPVGGGTVYPAARVVVTNTSTGVSRTLTTTGAGEYAAPNLEPGPYVVAAQAGNFKKAEHTGIRLART